MIRFHLAGSVCVDAGFALLSERELPGGQGRLLLAMLTLERRPIARDELLSELWGDSPPRAWETSLRALVSKVRAALAGVGLGDPRTLVSALGCYQLYLPSEVWVDVEAASDAVHRAEGDLRDGRIEEAHGWALAAAAIARRPFLIGADGPWASRRRRELHDVRVRALECRASVATSRDDLGLAVRDLEEVVALDPFREAAYQGLMRAHAKAGNPAQALQVYERCRRLLADELGVGPSVDTEAMYLELLRR